MKHCTAASSREVVCGWEQQKEDVQGLSMGKRTDHQQKSRATTRPASHSQGGSRLPGGAVQREGFRELRET